MGARPAPCHACLRHRLCVPGPLRLRRSRAVGASPAGGPRRSPSRAPIRLGRHADDDAGLLSVRLRPRARRLPGARRRGARGGAQSRPFARARVRGGHPAARPAVARGRRGPGRDGSARRLRHRVHVRLSHAHGGGLSGVDRHVRPRGGHPGCQRAADAGARCAAARARLARPPSLHGGRPPRRFPAHPAPRPAGRGRRRRLCGRPLARLRAPGVGAGHVGAAPRAGRACEPRIRRSGRVDVPAGRRLRPPRLRACRRARLRAATPAVSYGDGGRTVLVAGLCAARRRDRRRRAVAGRMARWSPGRGGGVDAGPTPRTRADGIGSGRPFRVRGTIPRRGLPDDGGRAGADPAEPRRGGALARRDDARGAAPCPHATDAGWHRVRADADLGRDDQGVAGDAPPRPFGIKTLAIEVWERTSESLWAEAALPALAIVAVGLVPLLVVTRLDGGRR